MPRIDPEAFDHYLQQAESLRRAAIGRAPGQLQAAFRRLLRQFVALYATRLGGNR